MALERLIDGDPSFGLSPGEYARREKARKRALFRVRQAMFSEAGRKRIAARIADQLGPAPAKPSRFTVEDRPSGKVIIHHGESGPVSLAYVSMMAHAK